MNMHAALNKGINSFKNALMRYHAVSQAFMARNYGRLMLIFGIAYRAALDANYAWAVSPAYAYEGMVLVPNAGKYMLSWVMYMTAFLYMPKEYGRTPVFLLHFQFIWMFTPIFAYYGLADADSRYIAMVFFCAMLQTFILRRHKDVPVKPLRITGIKNYVSVALLVILIPVLLIRPLYNGFAGLKAFDFVLYYQTIRSGVPIPGGFDYLFHWMAKAVIPFFLVYSLSKKRYAFAAACIAIQVLLYMESGYRGIFLFIIFILAIYILAQFPQAALLTYGGLTLLLLAIIVAVKSDIPSVARLGAVANSFIGERGLVSGGVNKFLFFRCFSELPKTYFSEGLIGKMLGLTYPYVSGCGYIAYAYGGGKFMESNSVTGYIGDSYAQLGFLGMVLSSVALAYIFRALYSLEDRKNFSILASVFAVHIIILTDAPLTTSFFSGGIWLSFVLAMIYLNGNFEGKAHGIQRT